MRLLLLQLKRIGDLVLTTPAIAELRHAFPEAHLTLVVAKGCRDLLPAIDFVHETHVCEGGAADVALLAKLLFAQRFDACLDFTGSDRSALLTLLSGARQRITFQSAKKKLGRRFAYNCFVDSPVRETHTIDHTLDLLRPLRAEFGGGAPPWSGVPEPVLHVPESARQHGAELLASAGMSEPFVIVHPGSARAEKYWEPMGWVHLLTHLREGAGLDCVLTGGSDLFEKSHLAAIAGSQAPPQREANAARAGVALAERPGRFTDLSGKCDLLTLAALVERARLVVSCDTAIVHFAAAFRTPQLALFGPTNPYHWRPRHPQALVLSAAQPEEPLREFSPRMRGAPTARLSTEAVLRATEALLAGS